MGAYIDLYKALQDLIDQIPGGMVSTPLKLADALGDRRATRAVSEALKRGRLKNAEGKVVRKPASDMDVFSEFSSDQPLRRLAELQKNMSERAVAENGLGAAELIAGVDAAYSGDEAFAVCVVLDRRLRAVESAYATVDVRFPYIPGYLSFREAPAVEAAAGLVSGFDVLLVNGHGVAHPRGCGLATHVGLDLGARTIGVAGRRLVGTVGQEVDGWSPLLHKGGVVGAVLTVKGRSPIYVSVGHRISLEASMEIVRGMISGGRLPEPLRMAHRAAEEFKLRGASGAASP